jgi:hypothetical protein
MTVVHQPTPVDVAGHLPKYAIGDKVILRWQLDRPGSNVETLYVVDYHIYGTPRRSVWEYRLSWRPNARQRDTFLAIEDSLLSYSEAIFHTTKADVERERVA